MILFVRFVDWAKNFFVTNERMNERMNGRTDEPMDDRHDSQNSDLDIYQVSYQ